MSAAPIKPVRWTETRVLALASAHARAKALGYPLPDDSAAIEWALRVAAQASATQAKRAAKA